MPDLGFFVTSFTKSVLTGLRVGYLVVPPQYSIRVASILRVTTWSATDGISQAQERQARAQIGEDMTFQKRLWAVQLAGWWVMGLILIAALACLFAAGSLSRSEARDGTATLLVEYDRFQRHMAPAELRLMISPEAASSDRTWISINDDLADAMKIESIVPEPEQAKATPTGYEYIFAVNEPGKPFSVRLFLGSINAEVGLREREPVRFGMFVYP